MDIVKTLSKSIKKILFQKTIGFEQNAFPHLGEIESERLRVREKE